MPRPGGGWAALRLLPPAEPAPSGQPGQAASRHALSLWRDVRFWLVIPAILAPSFVVTRFFFHQLFLLPLTLAMVAILLGCGSQAAAVAYLLLAGLTSGVSTIMATALWTDFYGVERLGSVRATVAGGGVIASALAPATFGWLLDLGISLRTQAAWCLGGMVVASLLTLPVTRRRR